MREELDPRNQKLYDLLELIKETELIHIDDLTPEEAVLMNELVRLKLVLKTNTRVTTLYSYGVNGKEY